MEIALRANDVVVERYGAPRVAIVEYGRYQRLVEAKQTLAQADNIQDGMIRLNPSPRAAEPARCRSACFWFARTVY